MSATPPAALFGSLLVNTSNGPSNRVTILQGGPIITAEKNGLTSIGALPTLLHLPLHRGSRSSARRLEASYEKKAGRQGQPLKVRVRMPKRTMDWLRLFRSWCNSRFCIRLCDK